MEGERVPTLVGVPVRDAVIVFVAIAETVGDRVPVVVREEITELVLVRVVVIVTEVDGVEEGERDIFADWEAEEVIEAVGVDAADRVDDGVPRAVLVG